MAISRIPINTFRLVLNPVIAPGTLIYTAPENVSTIILSLLIANTTTVDEYASILIQSGSAVSTLVSGSIVPRGETMIPFNARIVLEQFTSLVVSSSNTLDSTLSVLENANS
jgi:hypothetical protein